MTDEEYVRMSYEAETPYEYDLEESRRESAYEHGDTTQTLYRLFKYLPSDPNTLYSPVGQTGVGDERMGTTTFKRDEITKDIREQGFFAEASPLLAAQWFKYHREADFTKPTGRIKAQHKDPFSYAVFPISYGVAKNADWFRKHPEIEDSAEFGIADGLIVDEIKIIGDPVYEWTSEYTEDAQLRDKDERKNWWALESCMNVVRDPSLLEKWKASGVTAEQIEEMKSRARQVSKDKWQKEYEKAIKELHIHTEPILPPDDPRILAFLG